MKKSTKYFAYYPFVDGAEDEIDNSDMSISDAVENSMVINYAQNRIIAAIKNRPLNKDASDFYVESGLIDDIEHLITYPVSRIIISIIDQPGIRKRFGENEAQSAIHFIEEQDISKIDMLRELTADDDVIKVSDHPHFDYKVSILFFSNHTPDTEQYSLSNRAISDGYVYIVENESTMFEKAKTYSGRNEVTEILKHTIEDLVTKDLPLDVPQRIANMMREHTTPIIKELKMYNRTRDSDTEPPDTAELTYITTQKDSTRQDIVLECMELYRQGYTTDTIHTILPDWVPDTVITRVADGKYLPPTIDTIEQISQ